MKYRYNGQLKQYSTDMRKDMTKEERKLWFEFLRTIPLRIHRQKIIGNYIIDFYCASKKVAIELDGSQHYSDEGIDYDAQRTEFLNSQGISVLHYSNNDVMNNFDGVCTDILTKLDLI